MDYERGTGDMRQVRLGRMHYKIMVPEEYDIGAAYGDDPYNGSFWFDTDDDGRDKASSTCDPPL